VTDGPLAIEETARMSDSAFNTKASRSEPRWTPAVGAIVSIIAIWLAVLLISVFSPDMVHGSEQEHLPIAALTSWLWGSVASAFVLIAVVIGHSRSRDSRHVAWTLLALATIVIWAAVTIVSISTPRLETGTDPTKIPLAAMISPVVGTVATGFVAGLAALLSARGSQPSREAQP
jgi:hypothetical protein